MYEPALSRHSRQTSTGVKSFSVLDIAKLNMDNRIGGIGRQQSSVKSTGHKGPILSKIAREKLV